MNISDTTDVVIVGAGPTGLMAAGLLLRSGLTVRIIDKNEQQAHESRAFGVHAKSLELFLKIGLVEEFLQCGLMASGAQIYVNSRCVAELNFDDIGRIDTPYSFVLMVPQSQIEEILIKDLQRFNVKVEHLTELIDFEQSEESVMISLQQKDGALVSVQASYLIGADGAHSIVRKKLGLSFEGAAYPQGFLLADCKVDWPLDYDHIKMFLRDRTLAVFLPLKGKEVNRIIAIKSFSETENQQSRADSSAEPATLAEVEQALCAAAGFPIKLHSPLWVTAYRIHHREVNQFSKGRVFVAGDAAHIHSPAGGQGMNTGLQDVANLVWKLAVVLRGYGTGTLLETYNAERWPVGQKILNFTDKFFAKITTTTEWSARIRNWVVPVFALLVSKIKCIRRKAFSFISQLGIRYHDNPFLRNDFVSTSTSLLRAGKRAPNGLIKRHCDVFDLMQGYCFHVLAFSRKSLADEEINQIADKLLTLPRFMGLDIKTHFVGHALMGRHERMICAESSQVFEVYGVTYRNPNALFFIRPDGYIAYSSDQINIEELKKFLQQQFNLKENEDV